MTQTIEPKEAPEVEEWLRSFVGASEAYFIEWLREQALVEVS